MYLGLICNSVENSASGTVSGGILQCSSVTLCLWPGNSSCPSYHCLRSRDLQFSPLTLCSASLFTWVCHTTVAWIRRAYARYSINPVPSSQGSRARPHELQTACHLHAVKQFWRKWEKGVWEVLRLAGDRDGKGERVDMKWEGYCLVGADLQYHGAASSSAQQGEGTLWYRVVYIDLLTCWHASRSTVYYNV